MDGWQRDYEALFVDKSRPLDVKFRVEKATGCLLERDGREEPRIVFRGSSPPPDFAKTITVTLLAAEPGRGLYSFHCQASVTSQWTTEERFQAATDRAFDYWCGKLQVSTERFAGDHGVYEEWLRDTIERESQKAPEDTEAIAAVQQEIVAALKRGMRFATAHKEGGSTIGFHLGGFYREDYGEDPASIRYSEADFLTAIRSFYDWDSRRDHYPHRPPELDVWKFILGQLRP